MKQSRTLLATLTFFMILIFVASPALGQEEPPTGTTTPVTGSTVPLEQIDPAVPVQPPVETATQLDWTYRYMIPTALVLAVVVILMTSIRYFTNVVRKRYRIIEE